MKIQGSEKCHTFRASKIVTACGCEVADAKALKLGLEVDVPGDVSDKLIEGGFAVPGKPAPKTKSTAKKKGATK